MGNTLISKLCVEKFIVSITSYWLKFGGLKQLSCLPSALNWYWIPQITIELFKCIMWMCAKSFIMHNYNES